MSNSTTDRLYARLQQPIARFSFDEQVAAVFPDMIRRSVPGYANIISMIGIFATQYAQKGSRLYDLGCSLGAATIAMGQALSDKAEYRLIAVDNAAPMLDAAKAQARTLDLPPVEWLCADVREVEIHNASMVVLNFTLQFLPLDARLDVLRRVRSGLLPGGVLILSEKIAGANGREERLFTEMHHAFKRANGYSELEISQKRAALEKVLLPEPLHIHEKRLYEAGFSRVDRWFQCFNFVSILARP